MIDINELRGRISLFESAAGRKATSEERSLIADSLDGEGREMTVTRMAELVAGSSTEHPEEHQPLEQYELFALLRHAGIPMPVANKKACHYWAMWRGWVPSVISIETNSATIMLLSKGRRFRDIVRW